MPETFKNVRRAELQYLGGKPGFIIIETTLTEETDANYTKICNWCLKNISGSWSTQSIPKNGYRITFRMWDNEAIDKFKKKFKKFLFTP